MMATYVNSMDTCMNMATYTNTDIYTYISADILYILIDAAFGEPQYNPATHFNGLSFSYTNSVHANGDNIFFLIYPDAVP